MQKMHDETDFKVCFARPSHQHVQTGRCRCKTRVRRVCRTDEKARYGGGGGGGAQKHTNKRPPPQTSQQPPNSQRQVFKMTGVGVRGGWGEELLAPPGNPIFLSARVQGTRRRKAWSLRGSIWFAAERRSGSERRRLFSVGLVWAETCCSAPKV